MGFFDKIKSVVKNPTGAILGGGLGSAAFGVPGMIGGAVLGGSSNGSITDMLLGKKSKDIKPDEIANQIRATQSKGIGELNSALDTPADQIIGNQVEQQKKGILTSAQDARRNAQRTMAQRGLQNSSIGLGLNRSIDQQAGRDIASVNASLPGLIRDQKLQDAQTRIGVGNVNQNGMNFNTIQGARTGGALGIAQALAPLAGSVAGAYKDYQTGSLASRR
jgi:hypothetical protein